MIVALSSVGGSPGVTSWALLLAAGWPDSTIDRVVLEADPAGGVLGARYGLGVEPGAVGLVASCRRDAGLDIAAHGRVVSDGVTVVPAPELSESAQPLWVSGASTLATTLTLDQRTWILDLGRLDPSSPARDLASVAALNLLVVAPDAEQLVRLPARVESLRESGSEVGLLVLGSSAYKTDELQEFSGAAHVWNAPGHVNLPQLTARLLPGGRSRRHLIWRSAQSIASEVSELAVGASLRRDALAIGGES